MKKIILGVCVILGLGSAIALVKKRKAAVDSAPTATQALLKVRTVVPKERSVEEEASFLAKVEAARTATIASPFSARIRKIEVRENDSIRKGDILVRMDDTEITTSIASIKMQIIAAQKQYAYSIMQHKRNIALYKAGGLAKEKREASDILVSSAKAALTELLQKKKSLDNKLDYLLLRAPFDGVVGTIYMDEGSLAVPGKTILSFYSHHQKMTFSFADAAFHIQKSQEVRQAGVKIAVVSNIYKDTQNGLVTGEALVDSGDIPNGSFITISIVLRKVVGNSVPLQSLLHRPSGVSVMCYKDGQFVERKVRVLAQDKDYAVIASSLQTPIACAAEAKLSRLPAYGNIEIYNGTNHE